MNYSSTKRDRYRIAVAAVSGLTTFGALTASGFIAGAAAGDYEADQAQKLAAQQAEQAAYKAAKRERAAIIKANEKFYADAAERAANPKVIIRERKHVLHVTTNYVGGGSTTAGSGGTVSSSGGGYTGGSTSGGSSSGGSSSGGSSSGGGTSAPPPPPPPPPAPSSGS
jgi:hypothetical protein